MLRKIRYLTSNGTYYWSFPCGKIVLSADLKHITQIGDNTSTAGVQILSTSFRMEMMQMLTTSQLLMVFLKSFF